MYEFTGLPTKICPRCQAAEDEKYEKVRAYVRDHKGVSITEAAQETGVSAEQILRYLDEGKLEVIPGLRVPGWE
jgi:hypothetical protein